MRSGFVTARVGRVVKGLGALGLLVALAGGVPWALWHFIGWPLPHHVPSLGQVGHALNQRGIPDQALIDALAVVVWITWAVLVASIAVEIPAALFGRHAPRLPLAGIFQPVTGRLVAAVIVAALTLAPRPAHESPSGSLSGNPSSATVRRPVAALVLKDTALVDPAPIDPTFKDAVLTRATRPLPIRPPSPEAIAAPSGAAPSGTPVPTQPAGAPSTYVVQRGDTLWGIAERELGDPLEWQAIYQLNEGRTQPGGATLADPHWIDPGWTLLLPAASPPPAAPASPPPLTTPTSPTTAPPATAPPPTAPPLTAPPATTTPGAAIRAIPATPTPAAGIDQHRASHEREPVRLPSGSVVAGSFATGVLSAVALGRLRRRHAYRYRPPEPGRTLGPDPLSPTLRHLTTVVRAQETSIDPAIAAEAPPMADDDVEHRERPDVIDIGTRDGEPVSMALSEMAGITLGSPDADDVVRAWIAALMVRGGPIAAEVLTTQVVLDRLVPGVGPAFGNSADNPLVAVPGLRTVPDAETVLSALESEVLARTRHLDADEVA
ncbi:MAG: LysM peptidoglycan-binding domain-containing protein, partial [Actinomycetota bacterium]|nr:LysM peptidoglycan-binding domain-containing protein [Actinomycetota bacterium]